MKLDRLLGILTVLLQNDQVTAPYLAEKFEVTRRTIGRDIDALCKAGIPVVTRQGGGGGIAIAEGYKLDKSVLTTGELTDLIAALRGIGSVSHGSQVERTLDKLGARSDAVLSLQEPIMIDLASHYQGTLTDKIELLKQAIRERRVVDFDYYYEKGEMRRQMEPYVVVFQWTAWYVFGYCLLRRDWRLFKLGRLWDLQLGDGHYTPREIPPEQRDFGAPMPDDNRLVAVFEPAAKYQLIETYGPDCFTEMANGGLRVEMGYANRSHIIGWLLGFGDRVRVVEPPDLADELRAIAENMVAGYREQDTEMSG